MLLRGLGPRGPVLSWTLAGLLALLAARAGAQAAPAIHIVQPATGARFFTGDPITLQASTAADLSTTVTWDSDVEGPLGRGAVLLTVLAPGAHTVTARVTDGQGSTASDAITLDVVARPPGNTEPLVTITAPVAALPLAAGPPITFTGTARDLEDGDLTAALVWVSDRDGVLGAGGTMRHALTQGIHRITATALDAAGLAGSTVQVVQVGPPIALEFIPTADTTVDAAAPDLPLGTGPVLRVDANTVRHAYLRFAVSGVGTRAVAHAVLRLQVDAGEGAGSDSGGDVYALADHAWQEATTTYATRPALVGPPLASAGPVVRGQVVDFDVSAVVTADGGYDFALANASTDEVTYRSREGGPPPRLVLTLTGNPPVVTIDAPLGATDVRRGDPVVLAAHAVDLEDGDLGAGIAWTSSRDGLLGAGPSLTTSALSLGTHTLSATARDGEGAVGIAQVQLTVRIPAQEGGPPPTIPPANTAPVVAIAAPAGGSTLLTGQPVVLAATATDEEDGDLGAIVRWTSSRDGTLGTGATVVVPGLSVGTHTLTVTASDRAGAPAGASITITVVPPTLVFPAIADTYVDAGSPSGTFGGASVLIAGIAPATRQAFLRFAVSGLGPFTIQRALLRLTATTGSTTGGTLHGLSAGTWSEASTTYATRPTVDGLTLGTAGAVAVGQTVDFDVTRAIAGDGSYDFALASAARDGVSYASREAGAGPPVILVTLTQTTPPVVALRAPLPGATTDGGTPVSLVATATAADGTDLSGQITWTSSLEGVLGRGAVVTVPALGLGNHMLTASVVDADGLRGEAHTTIVVRRPNIGPTVTVIAPANASVIPAGTHVRLTALVADDTDQDIATRLAWTSSRDGALGTGATRTVVLSPGLHTLTAAVTDAGGITSQATATVRVNAAPTLAILTPSDGAAAVPGAPLVFAADARDAEDGALAPGVTWMSDRDGFLGSGSPLAATLRSGSHVLTATVTDRDGSRATTAVTITVNAVPVVTLTAPLPYWRFAPGDAVTLAATATDLEDGDLGPRIVWTSSLDGTLGTGPTLTRGTLTPGTHVLTATVTDAGGRTGEARVTLSPVECLLQPGPLVSLVGPYAGSYTNGALVADGRLDARAATFLASPTNHYPLNFGGASGVCFVGGTVVGSYDRTLSWSQMHYDNNNAGITFDNPHFLIDSVRIDNVTDGIRPRAGNDFTIRNTRMSYVRDDCIENDHLQGGVVDDSLLDGCYVAFSARPSQAIIDSGYNGAGEVWTIKNTLVRLQPMPGPSNPSPDGLGHGGFFKWHLWDNAAGSLSPKLALHDNVFLAERAGEVSADRMGIPPGQLASCSNNVVVWLGEGPYPAALPSCFTVTTDRRVWDNAVADWERRHPQVGP